MHVVFAVVIVSVLAPLMAGCTPYIPVKDDFGTSALVPVGDIPPEFAEFNAYQAAVNPLLADQICATRVIPLEDKGVGATPGQLIAARYRCQQHIPIIGE